MVSKRLIIVEDEPLLADVIELMITAAGGWETAGVASTEQEGHELLSAHQPDLAILDVKLKGGTTSASIATACRERGILIIYTTGYHAGDLVAQEDAVMVLTKPFTEEELAAALAAAEGQSATC